MELINWVKGKLSKKGKYKANYPKTIEEILDDKIKYRPSTETAMEKFKKSRPWRGSVEERRKKFHDLNDDLSKAYGIAKPTLVFPRVFVPTSSAYFPNWNMIVMEDLTVLTFLHEFGHALGFDERKTCWWSTNLFRKFFPKQYEQLIPIGHLLYKPETVAKMFGAGNEESEGTTGSLPKGKSGAEVEHSLPDGSFRNAA